MTRIQMDVWLAENGDRLVEKDGLKLRVIPATVNVSTALELVDALVDAIRTFPKMENYGK